MRKFQIYLLTLFLWSSCRDRNAIRNQSSDTTSQVSSVNHETKAVEIRSKTKTFSIREYGQRIIDNKIQPSDNTETFACLDSIDNENADTKKFFFQVYRVIAQKSDGALSEVVGSYTKSYLQGYPTEAIGSFKNLGSLDRKLFVDNLAFEFYASGTEHKAEINKYFAGIYNSNPEVKADSEIIEQIKNDLISVISKMND